jgi:hypothetical protein
VHAFHDITVYIECIGIAIMTLAMDATDDGRRTADGSDFPGI